ncbi:MAG: DMT family transporter [Pseudomonadota bacterium]
MTERKAHMDATGTSILLGFSILLGLNQALVKVVNDGFAPLFQSGLRSACAIPLVLGFALYARRNLSLNGSLPWGILNGMFFCLEFGLLFIALDYTTVARASLFFYVMPLWVAIGAHFLVPGENLHRNKMLGLGLAVCGLAIAFSGDLGKASPQAWLGDLLALLAGMFWAGIALLTRTKLQNVSSELNLLYQLVVSAVVLTACAALFGEMIREPTPLIYAIFSFQVVVVVAIGFLVWFWILSIYPVSNMASFSLLAPIFGVLFGWWIFDDALTWAFVGALLLAGAGVYLVNKPPRKPIPTT